jgi:hypothetical protein
MTGVPEEHRGVCEDQSVSIMVQRAQCGQRVGQRLPLGGGKASDEAPHEFHAGLTPRRQSLRRRLGEPQPGGAAIIGIGVTHQQSQVDELVHQRADGVGRQMQDTRCRGDPDTRLLLDHPHQFQLRAPQRWSG